MVDTVFTVGWPAFWIISAIGAQPVSTAANVIDSFFIEHLRYFLDSTVNLGNRVS